MGECDAERLHRPNETKREALAHLKQLKPGRKKRGIGKRSLSRKGEMVRGGITQTKREISQQALDINEAMESLNVGFRHRIQTLKKTSDKGPQLTKGWAVTEMVLDNLQLLLIATYPAIVRLGSAPDPPQ